MNTKNTNAWKLNEGHPPLDWEETVEVQFYDGSRCVDKVRNLAWIDNKKDWSIAAWREVIADNKDDEGWIKNTGVQPVEDDVEVYIRFGNGEEYKGSTPAGIWRWQGPWGNGRYDITYWKLAKPEISYRDSKDKSENTFELYTTELSVAAVGNNPIFGELVTKVRLQDDAAGMFLEIVQEGSEHNGQEQQVIRLEFPEFKKLIQAVNILEVNAKMYQEVE